jgi:tRNA (mo5U34)-methyltransferase
LSATEPDNLSVEELRERIIDLSPWHIDVQVTPQISTRVSQEASGRVEHPKASDDLGPVRFVQPREAWEKLMRRIYADGLQGRTFLECACNCGAYCFWAKELGASQCYGFDVREHWVKQAEFLLEHRTWPSDGIRFELHDLYELPERGLKPFDVTMFQGIFYHLPDPITGLKAAADLTREMLILDTATRNGLPDGMLAVAEESKRPVMSGVYGLNWFPTGPDVLRRILNWLGFVETRVVHWRSQRPGRRSDVGRVRMVASRTEGRLKAINSVDAPQPTAPEARRAG